MQKYLGLVCALYLFSTLSHANDSSIGLDAGNIYFKTSDGIAMLSEDLYISPKQVRVKYQFKNETDSDIKTLVGFPIAPFDGYVDIDTAFDPDSQDPLDFKTQVNGKRISVKMLRKEKRNTDGDIDLEFTYVWEQVFPAGKMLIVEHQYDPHPGGRIFIYDAQYQKTYCVEADAAAALKKVPQVMSHQVRYILRTGANWKGPIGQFRLVVDKLKTHALVSFCGENVHKISPTQFEMLKTNFKPKTDLSILFIPPQPRNNFE